MKSIFFNDIPLYLVTDLKHKSHESFYDIENIDLSLLMVKMEQGVLDRIYLHGNNADRLWHLFSGNFAIIEAAGGKVLNDKDQVLFIYRNDKWDLPKGKIEKGESFEDAAIREVKEETGIKNLKIVNQLESTYHIYKYQEKYILKISHWFKMITDYAGKLSPQEEEGITKVQWFDSSETKEALKNTYANIKFLF